MAKKKNNKKGSTKAANYGRTEKAKSAMTGSIPENGIQDQSDFAAYMEKMDKFYEQVKKDNQNGLVSDKDLKNVRELKDQIDSLGDDWQKAYNDMSKNISDMLDPRNLDKTMQLLKDMVERQKELDAVSKKASNAKGQVTRAQNRINKEKEVIDPTTGKKTIQASLADRAKHASDNAEKAYKDLQAKEDVVKKNPGNKAAIKDRDDADKEYKKRLAEKKKLDDEMKKAQKSLQKAMDKLADAVSKKDKLSKEQVASDTEFKGLTGKSFNVYKGNLDEATKAIQKFENTNKNLSKDGQELVERNEKLAESVGKVKDQYAGLKRVGVAAMDGLKSAASSAMSMIGKGASFMLALPMKAVRMITGLGSKLIGMGEGLFRKLMQISEGWRQQDDAIHKLVPTMGLVGKSFDAYREKMFAGAVSIGYRWNKSLTDMVKLQQDYMEKTGRSIELTNKQMDKQFALNKVMGDEEGSALTTSMKEFGHDIDSSVSMWKKMYDTANKWGVSVKKTSKELLQNLRLAQDYNFSGGVKNLMSMQVWAEKTKFNMGNTGTLVDNFSNNLDDTITKASQLQMLGGSFAANSDPFSLMYNAISDPEALAKQVNGMVKNMGSFNKQTGEVDLSGGDFLRMKQAASVLGVSVGDLRKQANEGVTRDYIQKNEISQGSGLNQDEIDNLASKAQYDTKTGQHYVTYTDQNGEQKINIKDINAGNKDQVMKNLMPQTEKESVIDIAKNTRSINDLLGGIKTGAGAELNQFLDKHFHNPLEKGLTKLGDNMNKNRYVTKGLNTAMNMVLKGGQIARNWLKGIFGNTNPIRQIGSFLIGYIKGQIAHGKAVIQLIQGIFKAFGSFVAKIPGLGNLGKKIVDFGANILKKPGVGGIATLVSPQLGKAFASARMGQDLMEGYKNTKAIAQLLKEGKINQRQANQMQSQASFNLGMGAGRFMTGSAKGDRFYDTRLTQMLSNQRKMMEMQEQRKNGRAGAGFRNAETNVLTGSYGQFTDADKVEAKPNDNAIFFQNQSEFQEGVAKTQKELGFTPVQPSPMPVEQTPVSTPNVTVNVPQATTAQPKIIMADKSDDIYDMLKSVNQNMKELIKVSKDGASSNNKALSNISTAISNSSNNTHSSPSANIVHARSYPYAPAKPSMWQRMYDSTSSTAGNMSKAAFGHAVQSSNYQPQQTETQPLQSGSYGTQMGLNEPQNQPQATFFSNSGYGNSSEMPITDANAANTDEWVNQDQEMSAMDQEEMDQANIMGMSGQGFSMDDAQQFGDQVLDGTGDTGGEPGSTLDPTGSSSGGFSTTGMILGGLGLIAAYKGAKGFLKSAASHPIKTAKNVGSFIRNPKKYVNSKLDDYKDQQSIRKSQSLDDKNYHNLSPEKKQEIREKAGGSEERLKELKHEARLENEQKAKGNTSSNAQEQIDSSHNKPLNRKAVTENTNGESKPASAKAKEMQRRNQPTVDQGNSGFQDESGDLGRTEPQESVVKSKNVEAPSKKPVNISERQEANLRSRMKEEGYSSKRINKEIENIRSGEYGSKYKGPKEAIDKMKAAGSKPGIMGRARASFQSGVQKTKSAVQETTGKLASSVKSGAGKIKDFGAKKLKSTGKALSKAAGSIKNGAGSLMKSAKSLTGKAGKAISGAAKGLSKNASSLMNSAKSLSGKAVGALAKGGSGLIKGTGNIFKGAGSLIKGGGLLKSAGRIFARGGGILGKALGILMNCGGLLGKVSGLFKGLGGKLMGGLKDLVGGAKNLVKGGAGKLAVKAGTIGSKIKGAAGNLMPKARNMGTAIVSTSAKTGGGIISKAKNAGKGVLAKVKNIIPGAGKASEAAKAASTVSKGGGFLKSIGNATKGLSKAGGLFKVGKNLIGKAGGALTVGLAAMDAYSAVSDYNDQEKQIESSKMSQKDKEKAIGNLKNERNGKVGGSIGSVVGGAIGTVIGGPVGTLVGSIGGQVVGEYIGKNATKIGNALKSFGNTVSTGAKKAWGWIKEGFTGGKAKDVAKGFLVGGPVGALVMGLSGPKTREKIKGAFSRGLGFIKDGASGLLKGATNILKNIGSGISNAASGIMNFFTGGEKKQAAPQQKGGGRPTPQQRGSGKPAPQQKKKSWISYLNPLSWVHGGMLHDVSRLHGGFLRLHDGFVPSTKVSQVAHLKVDHNDDVIAAPHGMFNNLMNRQQQAYKPNININVSPTPVQINIPSLQRVHGGEVSNDKQASETIKNSFELGKKKLDIQLNEGKITEARYKEELKKLKSDKVKEVNQVYHEKISQKYNDVKKKDDDSSDKKAEARVIKKIVQKEIGTPGVFSSGMADVIAIQQAAMMRNNAQQQNRPQQKSTTPKRQSQPKQQQPQQDKRNWAERLYDNAVSGVSSLWNRFSGGMMQPGYIVSGSNKHFEAPSDATTVFWKNDKEFNEVNMRLKNSGFRDLRAHAAMVQADKDDFGASIKTNQDYTNFLIHANSLGYRPGKDNGVGENKFMENNKVSNNLMYHGGFLRAHAGSTQATPASAGTMELQGNISQLSGETKQVQQQLKALSNQQVSSSTIASGFSGINSNMSSIQGTVINSAKDAKITQSMINNTASGVNAVGKNVKITNDTTVKTYDAVNNLYKQQDEQYKEERREREDAMSSFYVSQASGKSDFTGSVLMNKWQSDRDADKEAKGETESTPQYKDADNPDTWIYNGATSNKGIKDSDNMTGVGMQNVSGGLLRFHDGFINGNMAHGRRVKADKDDNAIFFKNKAGLLKQLVKGGFVKRVHAGESGNENSITVEPESSKIIKELQATIKSSIVANKEIPKETWKSYKNATALYSSKAGREYVNPDGTNPNVFYGKYYKIDDEGNAVPEELTESTTENSQRATSNEPQTVNANIPEHHENQYSISGTNKPVELQGASTGIMSEIGYYDDRSSTEFGANDFVMPDSSSWRSSAPTAQSQSYPQQSQVSGTSDASSYPDGGGADYGSYSGGVESYPTGDTSSMDDEMAESQAAANGVEAPAQQQQQPKKKVYVYSNSGTIGKLLYQMMKKNNTLTVQGLASTPWGKQEYEKLINISNPAQINNAKKYAEWARLYDSYGKTSNGGRIIPGNSPFNKMDILTMRYVDFIRTGNQRAFTRPMYDVKDKNGKIITYGLMSNYAPAIAKKEKSSGLNLYSKTGSEIEGYVYGILMNGNKTKPKGDVGNYSNKIAEAAAAKMEGYNYLYDNLTPTQKSIADKVLKRTSDHNGINVNKLGIGKEKLTGDLLKSKDIFTSYRNMKGADAEKIREMLHNINSYGDNIAPNAPYSGKYYKSLRAGDRALYRKLVGMMFKSANGKSTYNPWKDGMGANAHLSHETVWKKIKTLAPNGDIIDYVPKGHFYAGSDSDTSKNNLKAAITNVLTGFRTADAYNFGKNKGKFDQAMKMARQIRSEYASQVEKNPKSDRMTLLKNAFQKFAGMYPPEIVDLVSQAVINKNVMNNRNFVTRDGSTNNLASKKEMFDAFVKGKPLNSFGPSKERDAAYEAAQAYLKLKKNPKDISAYNKLAFMDFEAKTLVNDYLHKGRDDKKLQEKAYRAYITGDWKTYGALKGQMNSKEVGNIWKRQTAEVKQAASFAHSAKSGVRKTKGGTQMSIQRLLYGLLRGWRYKRNSKTMTALKLAAGAVNLYNKRKNWQQGFGNWGQALMKAAVANLRAEGTRPVSVGPSLLTLKGGLIRTKAGEIQKDDFKIDTSSIAQDTLQNEQTRQLLENTGNKLYTDPVTTAKLKIESLKQLVKGTDDKNTRKQLKQQIKDTKKSLNDGSLVKEKSDIEIKKSMDSLNYKPIDMSNVNASLLSTNMDSLNSRVPQLDSAKLQEGFKVAEEKSKKHRDNITKTYGTDAAAVNIGETYPLSNGKLTDNQLKEIYKGRKTRFQREWSKARALGYETFWYKGKQYTTRSKYEKDANVWKNRISQGKDTIGESIKFNVHDYDGTKKNATPPTVYVSAEYDYKRLNHKPKGNHKHTKTKSTQAVLPKEDIKMEQKAARMMQEASDAAQGKPVSDNKSESQQSDNELMGPQIVTTIPSFAPEMSGVGSLNMLSGNQNLVERFHGGVRKPNKSEDAHIGGFWGNVYAVRRKIRSGKWKPGTNPIDMNFSYLRRGTANKYIPPKLWKKRSYDNRYTTFSFPGMRKFWDIADKNKFYPSTRLGRPHEGSSKKAKKGTQVKTNRSTIYAPYEPWRKKNTKVINKKKKTAQASKPLSARPKDEFYAVEYDMRHRSQHVDAGTKKARRDYERYIQTKHMADGLKAVPVSITPTYAAENHNAENNVPDSIKSKLNEPTYKTGYNNRYGTTFVSGGIQEPTTRVHDGLISGSMMHGRRVKADKDDNAIFFKNKAGLLKQLVKGGYVKRVHGGWQGEIVPRALYNPSNVGPFGFDPGKAMNDEADRIQASANKSTTSNSNDNTEARRKAAAEEARRRAERLAEERRRKEAERKRVGKAIKFEAPVVTTDQIEVPAVDAKSIANANASIKADIDKASENEVVAVPKEYKEFEKNIGKATVTGTGATGVNENYLKSSRLLASFNDKSENGKSRKERKFYKEQAAQLQESLNGMIATASMQEAIDSSSLNTGFTGGIKPVIPTHIYAPDDLDQGITVPKVNLNPNIPTKIDPVQANLALLRSTQDEMLNSKGRKRRRLKTQMESQQANIKSLVEKQKTDDSINNAIHGEGIKQMLNSVKTTLPENPSDSAKLPEIDLNKAIDFKKLTETSEKVLASDKKENEDIEKNYGTDEAAVRFGKYSDTLFKNGKLSDSDLKQIYKGRKTRFQREWAKARALGYEYFWYKGKKYTTRSKYEKDKDTWLGRVRKDSDTSKDTLQNAIKFNVHEFDGTQKNVEPKRIYSSSDEDFKKPAIANNFSLTLGNSLGAQPITPKFEGLGDLNSLIGTQIPVTRVHAGGLGKALKGAASVALQTGLAVRNLKATKEIYSGDNSAEAKNAIMDEKWNVAESVIKGVTDAVSDFPILNKPAKLLSGVFDIIKFNAEYKNAKDLIMSSNKFKDEDQRNEALRRLDENKQRLIEGFTGDAIGTTVGAILGNLIPIPVVGSLIGGMLGGWIGKGAAKAVRWIKGIFTGKKSNDAKVQGGLVNQTRVHDGFISGSRMHGGRVKADKDDNAIFFKNKAGLLKQLVKGGYVKRVHGGDNLDALRAIMAQRTGNGAFSKPEKKEEPVNYAQKVQVVDVEKEKREKQKEAERLAKKQQSEAPSYAQTVKVEEPKPVVETKTIAPIVTGQQDSTKSVRKEKRKAFFSGLVDGIKTIANPVSAVKSIVNGVKTIVSPNKQETASPVSSEQMAKQSDEKYGFHFDKEKDAIIVTDKEKYKAYTNDPDEILWQKVLGRKKLTQSEYKRAKKLYYPVNKGMVMTAEEEAAQSSKVTAPASNVATPTVNNDKPASVQPSTTNAQQTVASTPSVTNIKPLTSQANISSPQQASSTTESPATKKGSEETKLHMTTAELDKKIDEENETKQKQEKEGREKVTNALNKAIKRGSKTAQAYMNAFQAEISGTNLKYAGYDSDPKLVHAIGEARDKGLTTITYNGETYSTRFKGGKDPKLMGVGEDLDESVAGWMGMLINNKVKLNKAEKAKQQDSSQSQTTSSTPSVTSVKPLTTPVSQVGKVAANTTASSTPTVTNAKPLTAPAVSITAPSSTAQQSTPATSAPTVANAKPLTKQEDNKTTANSNFPKPSDGKGVLFDENKVNASDTDTLMSMMQQYAKLAGGDPDQNKNKLTDDQYRQFNTIRFRWEDLIQNPISNRESYISLTENSLRWLNDKQLRGLESYYRKSLNEQLKAGVPGTHYKDWKTVIDFQHKKEQEDAKKETEREAERNIRRDSNGNITAYIYMGGLMKPTRVHDGLFKGSMLQGGHIRADKDDSAIFFKDKKGLAKQLVKGGFVSAAMPSENDKPSTTVISSGIEAFTEKNSPIAADQHLNSSAFIQSSQDNGNIATVNPVSEPAGSSAVQGANGGNLQVDMKPLKVDINGTIKLDTGSQQVDIMSILKSNPQFITELTRMIQDQMTTAMKGRGNGPVTLGLFAPKGK